MSKKFRRRWLWRALAVLMGLSPFLALEMVLRVLGMPRQHLATDPYVDLHNLTPLFEWIDDASQSAPATGTMAIAAGRLNLFQPAEFESPKPKGTFRVFALGGSTTQGEPFSPETAFPKWLEIALQTAAPERTIEVVNCGGLSYASYRVLAILREVLGYEPDLIFVYTGQNEYLEYRSYESFQADSWSAATVRALCELKTVQACRTAWGAEGFRSGQAPTKTSMAGEVDALLDYRGGLEQYRRGDKWRESIAGQFQWNIRAMAEACRAAEVPLVFVRPVSNLLDCPPMKFEPAPELSSQQKAEFESAWLTAREAKSPEQSRAAAEQALAIDPLHSGAHYLLGQLLFQAGEFPEAHRHLRLARDCDVCPLRAPQVLLDAMSEVAGDLRVPMLDAEELFEERSDHGIVGRKWLVDHIHPSVDGHQLLGNALAELCIAENFVTPTHGSWTNDLEARYAEHLSTLNAAYYERGKQRLEGLLLWTQGRANKAGMYEANTRP